jgi:type 1 fimbriae regulatory protein FimB
MRVIKYLTQNELKRLLKTAKAHSFRDFLIILLAYRHGLRASEVGMLRVSDIDFSRGKIYVHREKNGIPGEHPLANDEIKYLKRYLRERKDKKNNILFTSNRRTAITRYTLDKMFRKYGKGADIPEDKRHFHTLRHSAGVHRIEAGMDILLVKDWLGHRNIQNTVIYTYVSNPLRDNAYRSALMSGKIV